MRLEIRSCSAAQCCKMVWPLENLISAGISNVELFTVTTPVNESLPSQDALHPQALVPLHWTSSRPATKGVLFR